MKNDKKWLKKELVRLKVEADAKNEYGSNYTDEQLAIKRVFSLIDQLDEPEKVVVPQFVADYIELNKGWSEDRQEYIEDDNSGLWFALNGDSYGMPNSVSDWLFNEEKVETFAKAWLDGYEVEKEKRYQVKIPITVWDGDASELKKHTLFLAYDITSGEMRILSQTPRRGDFRTDLTEAEIKAIDKRYWAFAEEVTK